jgi:hypothetical protein
MNNELVEIVGTYVFFFILYPVAIAAWAYSDPLWSSIWFGSGVVVFVLLRRYLKWAVPIWLAIWFMPGTVLCGAAMLLPWPVTIYGSSGPHSCGSALSLAVCLALNFAVVFGVRALYPRVRLFFRRA